MLSSGKTFYFFCLVLCIRGVGSGAQGGQLADVFCTEFRIHSFLKATNEFTSIVIGPHRLVALDYQGKMGF